MAPVTEIGGQAVLVAHGLPSDPAPQDAVMKALASDVAHQLPGWTVRGATLAMAGSLEESLDGLDNPLVYPFFMAEGVFTTQFLPQRLQHLNCGALQLPPFGTDRALAALMAEAAVAGATAAGLDPRATTLLIAAHGSKISQTSKITALESVRQLGSLVPFKAIVTGFIEEAPFLNVAAQGLGPAICLPFFALRAGHVENDIPEALADAGFTGPLLPAIGEHPCVPKLIAASLAHAVKRLAA